MREAVLIADSSPLIGLARIGQLALLPHLAEKVVVPPAVWDDSRARRVAERLRVRRIGTVGLLRRAKKAGMIDQLRPHLDSLKQHGIYLQQELVEAVLKDVGE